MRKKKVVIVLHGLGANGIDTLFANLSKQWNLEEYDITYFLAVDEGAKQFWEDKVLENGVKVIHITDLDGKKLFKWPFNLYKYLKKYGPFDAIHVNMDMLNGINVLVAKLAGLPIRISHSHTSSNKKGAFKKFYLCIMRMLMKKCSTHKIACSEVSGDYFYGANYTTLYNGIELSKYLNNKRGLIDKSSPCFITVGRISEPKNPFFIVELMKEIVRKKPEARLIWVGGGELKSNVKEKAEIMGVDNNIEFLGVCKDVNTIFSRADYFLMPSLYEGFGLALVEAQASGLDCFASHTIPKLVDCGRCKFISLEKSASEWADEICNYIDSGAEMQLNHTQMDKFDISCMARKLEDMYSS